MPATSFAVGGRAGRSASHSPHAADRHPTSLERARGRMQSELTETASHWKRLAESRAKRQPIGRAALLRFLGEYDNLSIQLYRARRELSPSDPLRRRLEEFMAGVSQEILALQPPEKAEESYRLWRARYRALWKEHLLLFLFTSALFIACLILGWNLVVADPGNASAIIPQRMLEDVLDRHRWFATLARNPVFDGLAIAINNIKVSVNCFILGAALAAGGVWLLAYNGILFGAVMAYCYVHQFHEALIDFVVGHGPLELTIIVASAFSGFVIGRTFFQRPFSQIGRRLPVAASQGLTLVLGVLPWLVVAALIEAFISPLDFVDFYFKLGLGIVAATLFWLWTFWPSAPVKGSETP